MKAIVAGMLVACVAAARPGAGGQEDLLKALAGSKHSLEEGIRQLTRDSEVAISGKFEMEDGHLSLSIYTAEKGLGVDAEHNVLKEYAGSPEAAEWKPGAEVFKDVPHVARSSMQLTVLSLSKCSLLDILEKVKKDQAGTVYSITPLLRDRKGTFVVLVASGGKTVELCYDLSGALADKKQGKVFGIPAQPHATVKEAEFSVEFGCVGDDYAFVEITGAKPDRIEWINARGDAVDAEAVARDKGRLPEGFGRPVELRVHPRR